MEELYRQLSGISCLGDADYPSSHRSVLRSAGDHRLFLFSGFVMDARGQPPHAGHGIVGGSSTLALLAMHVYPLRTFRDLKGSRHGGSQPNLYDIERKSQSSNHPTEFEDLTDARCSWMFLTLWNHGTRTCESLQRQTACLSYDEKTMVLINILPGQIRAVVRIRLHMFPDPLPNSPQLEQNESFSKL